MSAHSNTIQTVKHATAVILPGPSGTHCEFGGKISVMFESVKKQQHVMFVYHAW